MTQGAGPFDLKSIKGTRQALILYIYIFYHLAFIQAIGETFLSKSRILDWLLGSKTRLSKVRCSSLLVGVIQAHGFPVFLYLSSLNISCFVGFEFEVLAR